MTGDLGRLLEERAAVLRQPLDPGEAASHLDVLVLSVGRERLGLPLAEAEAVVADVTVAPLPNLRAPWSGVVHLRGRFVAVADLGLLAGGQRTDVRHVVVLTADDRCALGLEEAPRAARISTDALAATSHEGSTISRSLRGTAPDGTALFDSAVLVAALQPHHPSGTGRI